MVTFSIVSVDNNNNNNNNNTIINLLLCGKFDDFGRFSKDPK